ncbi:MAG: hypothetical protein HY914_00620 [Desulfomonile tiedjei]|nr:hypothetical protein [Desulfomonile tiedjei]
MERIILSAVVLIITNLILGSISLSLGLVVAIILAGVALIALVFFALLGFCLMLEKLGWLSSGWTESKIDRLRNWASRKWHEMPAWYASEKKRIIEMLIDRLRRRKRDVDAPVKMWKWAAVGLIVLLAVVLVKYRLNLTVGWSLAVVALGSLVISVPVMYFTGPKEESNGRAGGIAHQGDPLTAVTGMDATPEEIRAALATLVELHRSGRLSAMLERTSDTDSPSVE